MRISKIEGGGGTLTDASLWMSSIFISLLSREIVIFSKQAGFLWVLIYFQLLENLSRLEYIK